MSPLDCDEVADAAIVSSGDWLSEFFAHFEDDVAGAAFDVTGDYGVACESDQAVRVGQLTGVGTEAKKRKAVDEEEVKSESVMPSTGTRSHVLSEGAKKTKSTREKKRRDALNTRFDELQAVLELGEASKADKASVVAAATVFIKRLRAELSRLAEVIMRLKEDNLHKAELTHALAAERDVLAREKAQLLHEKLRIESQLQGFLTSMPFASPVDGMVSSATAKSVRLQMPSWTIPTPFLMPNASEGEEDVTLRAPVA